MNDRQSLLELLDAYVGVHSDERVMVDRVRALVAEHADCFERTCVPGHITASAWIVSADRSACLLTHHRKLGRWLQLGGHADGDPDPLAVALREAEEESGMRGFEVLGNRNASRDGRVLPLDVDVHDIPARGDEPRHEHHDIRYLLVAPADQPIVVSDESHDVAWHPLDAVTASFDEESILRMARKAVRWL